MESLLSNINTTEAIIVFLCGIIIVQQVGVYNLIAEVRRLSKEAGESASPRMQLMLSMMTPSQDMLQRGAVWFDEYVQSDSNPSNDKYGTMAKKVFGIKTPETVPTTADAANAKFDISTTNNQ